MIDARIFYTLYAMAFVAWVSILPMINRAKPGSPDFRLHMDRVSKAMSVVMCLVVLVAFVQFVQWIWS